MKEIEIKIKLDDSQALMKKAENLGAVKVSEGLEHDVMFSNNTDEFKSDEQTVAKKVLRLRKSPNGNYLTLKMKPESEHKYLLVREEIETKVDDFDKADLIIQKLGFEPFRIKEKITVKYNLDGFVLEFHKLPFLGNFLEIEAEEEKLKFFLPKIGLSLQQGITSPYTHLFYDYCQEHGLSIETPQTFEEEKRLLVDKK